MHGRYIGLAFPVRRFAGTPCQIVTVQFMRVLLLNMLPPDILKDILLMAEYLKVELK